jgi:hypothetical protein
MFSLPETRRLILGWEDEARQVLSQFRAETTSLRDDPAVVSLVARLRATSPEFDEWWGRTSGRGPLRDPPPEDGLLVFGTSSSWWPVTRSPPRRPAPRV